MTELAFYAVASFFTTFGLLIGCALGANARSRLVDEIERSRLTADSADARECA